MLLDELATLLAGVATKGSDLFFGGLPEQPVNAVCLLQFGGPGDLETMGDTTILERPRVLVTVRNTSQKTAWQKLDAIHALLRRYSSASVLRTRVLSAGEETLDEISREGRRGANFRVQREYEFWTLPQ